MNASFGYGSQEYYNDPLAQVNFGFVGTIEITSPVSLLTFGFLWPCGDIWIPANTTLSTGWTNSLSVLATSWTGIPTISTSWSGVPTTPPWAPC